MTEEKQAVTLRSAISATFAGVFRGTDPSLVFLGLFALLGVIVSTSLTIWTPWGGLGTIVFLLFFLYILWVWGRGTAVRSTLDLPSTRLNFRSGEDEVSLSVPSGNELVAVKRLLTHMREIVQARHLPPTPRGEILGSPSNDKSLREYSHEERSAVEKRWAEEIPLHDRQIIDQLTSSVKTLEGLGAQSIGDVVGLQQSVVVQKQQSGATGSTVATPETALKPASGPPALNSGHPETRADG
jgi:hypothetical protein